MKRYLTIFFLVYVIASVSIIWFKRTDLFPWIGGCNPAGYADDNYMAYCNAPRYGNYEHWTTWHGAEEDVIENLQKAELLFLGNSSTQCGFSTDAANNFSRVENIPHYAFGFSHGGASPLAIKMIERYALSPKVVVINADPFFNRKWNDIHQVMVSDDESIAREYTIKKWFQKQQREVCQDDSSLLAGLMCQGDAKTIYRNRENGHWDTRFFGKDKRIATALTEKSLDGLDEAVEVAAEFTQSTGIDPQCTIITVVPQSHTELKFAQLLAEKTGMPGVFPAVEGYTTIDDSHMSKDSAERWSEEFLTLAAPIIKRCAAQGDL